MKNSIVNRLPLILIFIFFVIGVYYFGRQSAPVIPINITPSQIPAVRLPTATVTPTKTTLHLTSTPGIGQKTYTNKKYGFSFQYPSNWNFEKSIDNNIPYYGEGTVFMSCSTSTLVLSVLDLNRSDSAYQSFSQFIKNSPSLIPPTKSKDIRVAGYDGKYYKDLGDPGSVTPSVGVAFYNNKDNVIVTLYFTDSCQKGLDSAIKTDFNQILSTFKFIK